MIKHFILLALSLFCLSAFAQLSPQSSDSDCAAIKFSFDTVNFGSLKHNSEAYCELKYKSVGKCPLVIFSVKGLSGRQFKEGKRLVTAGDSAYCYIYYPTDVPGPFTKTLVFTTNAGIKQVAIKGVIKPEEICAGMKFASDTLDLGPVPYGYGKHFVIKVPSTGKCPLLFNAIPTLDYMDVMAQSIDPITPGDSGIINVRIGGAVVGNYYGLLTITSANAVTGHKTLFIKAKFMPPADKKDTTEIEVEKDMMNVGDVKPGQIVTVLYTVKNTGHEKLIIRADKDATTTFKISGNSVVPGKTCTVTALVRMGGNEGPFIKSIIINGNFTGKRVPLYIKGNLVGH
jgi:hypothetical protein